MHLEFIYEIEELISERLKYRKDTLNEVIISAFQSGIDDVYPTLEVSDQEDLLLSFVKTEAYIEFNLLIQTILKIINLELQSFILNNLDNELTEEQYEHAIEKIIQNTILDHNHIWCRIIHTAINDSYQIGRSCAIKAKTNCDNPIVYKESQDTDNITKSLYKEDNETKYFHLQDLLKNGINNRLRETRDFDKDKWKPVLGSTHTWCTSNLLLKTPPQ